MPTYEYLCSSCGHKFDLLKALKDIDAREKCQKCGASAQRQLTFPAAIVIN